MFYGATEKTCPSQVELFRVSNITTKTTDSRYTTVAFKAYPKSNMHADVLVSVPPNAAAKQLIMYTPDGKSVNPNCEILFKCIDLLEGKTKAKAASKAWAKNNSTEEQGNFNWEKYLEPLYGKFIQINVRETGEASCTMNDLGIAQFLDGSPLVSSDVSAKDKVKMVEHVLNRFEKPMDQKALEDEFGKQERKTPRNRSTPAKA